MKEYQNNIEIEKCFIEKQWKLANKIDLKNCIKIDSIKYIGGVDLAYWKENNCEYAVCCIVIVDYISKHIVEERYNIQMVEVPYIPGCLAFREIPIVLETVKLLKIEPDLYVFDGNGYLHPRHMGLATHAGIVLNKPSIGIAKSYFKVLNTDYIEPANEKFAFEDIIIENEIYGRVVRTQKGVKPIFLSIGNKINLDTAMQIVKDMTGNESHIPIPTRFADIMTHKIRKKSKETKYEGVGNQYYSKA